MTDAAVRLAARYPRVWHVMEAEGAGEWLADTGLLLAASLRPGGTNRADFEAIDMGNGRTAIVRPQQMPDDRLIATLAAGSRVNRRAGASTSISTSSSGPRHDGATPSSLTASGSARRQSARG